MFGLHQDLPDDATEHADSRAGKIPMELGSKPIKYRANAPLNC